MDEPRVHEPVLCEEVWEHLAPGPAATLVDLTVGAGGHAGFILERMGPGARYVGIDRDAVILGIAAERLARFGDRVRLVAGRSDALPALLRGLGIARVDGILMDLGVSSLQLDDPARGFSFLRGGPLDMRMSRDDRETAAALLARASAPELERIFRDYGEEPYARRLASVLGATPRDRRPRTTDELAELVLAHVPSQLRGRSRVHPATRVFQALRIAVNDELGILERTLPLARGVLAGGGRLVTIAFHSLEDRIVKHWMRNEAQADRLVLLTKKPVTATEAEVARNPRSRSAKLRAAATPSGDARTERRGRRRP